MIHFCYMSWMRKNARGRGMAWHHRCEITGRESVLRREHLLPFANGCPDCHTNPDDLPEAHPCPMCFEVKRSRVKLRDEYVVDGMAVRFEQILTHTWRRLTVCGTCKRWQPTYHDCRAALETDEGILKREAS